MPIFLRNGRLREGLSDTCRRGTRPPLDADGRIVAGYRYRFRGAVRQCRLCVHHRPRNVRCDGTGAPCYTGAFSCDVKDFSSSSGYVVVVGCDRWECSGSAPRKNRGKAWLHLRPVKERKP